MNKAYFHIFAFLTGSAVLFFMPSRVSATDSVQSNTNDCHYFEGIFELSNYTLDSGKRCYFSSVEFKAYVNLPKWRITVLNEPTNLFISDNMYFDGKHRYFFSPSRTNAANTAIIYNADDQFSLPNNDIYIIWFALASGFFLESQNTNIFIIPALWLYPSSSGAYSIYGRVHDFDKTFKIPISVSFHASWDLWLKEHKMRYNNGDIPSNLRKPPFPDNFKCAEYNVETPFSTSSTNFPIPFRGHLKRYSYQLTNHTRTSAILLRTEAVVYVTNYSVVNYNQWIPELHGHCFITDYRFSRPGTNDFRVGYIAMTKEFLPTNSPIVLKALERKMIFHETWKNFKEPETTINNIR